VNISEQATLVPAVFVDRDGTLMEDVPYIRDPASVRLFPGVPEALRRLRDAGFRIVMVTNQSGIGRGWSTMEDFARVQDSFFNLAGQDLFDAVYMCPDGPDQPSERRKPAPGMVFEAARDLSLDLNRSWLIGDKPSDIECGVNAGVRAIQVRTGEGAGQKSERAVHIAEDIGRAAEFILRELVGVRSA
jgi:D-glycero-D-manno-heptose 1,7-bisphosphate phosphatase